MPTYSWRARCLAQELVSPALACCCETGPLSSHRDLQALDRTHESVDSPPALRHSITAAESFGFAMTAGTARGPSSPTRT